MNENHKGSPVRCGAKMLFGRVCNKPMRPCQIWGENGGQGYTCGEHIIHPLPQDAICSNCGHPGWWHKCSEEKFEYLECVRGQMFSEMRARYEEENSGVENWHCCQCKKFVDSGKNFADMAGWKTVKAPPIIARYKNDTFHRTAVQALMFWRHTVGNVHENPELLK